MGNVKVSTQVAVLTHDLNRVLAGSGRVELVPGAATSLARPPQPTGVRGFGHKVAPGHSIAFGHFRAGFYSSCLRLRAAPL
jgi:hypothetical protein